MDQAKAYKSLFPNVPVYSPDFNKLELLVTSRMGKSHMKRWERCAMDAITYGTSTHRIMINEDISTMPRTLFSFHPARNNQIVRSMVNTLAELQEALDNNPDFTHISEVNGGKHWLIHKGPVTGKSAANLNVWKRISFKRLPKPLRMRLVIEPLGE